MKIVIAGTGYVDLSTSVLVAQHNKVLVLDSIPGKVEMSQNKISLVNGKYMSEYLLKDELTFYSNVSRIK